MQNIICAANPLKEVLPAGECLNALMAGASRSNPGAAQGFLISDGGDGFLDAIAHCMDLEKIEVQCTAPLGEVITAPLLLDRSRSIAYIESASCCGLRLVEPSRRNIMISGTAGLGDLLAAARDAGIAKTFIGLGGSATCDGGVGLIWRLACLAGQFQADPCEPRNAIDLAESAVPDLEQISHWLGNMQLIACVDVDNPLTGPHGAARVYAAQKGASPEEVDQLEAWISRWCERIERFTQRSLGPVPGAGAAGGLGFALLALGGEIVPGADMVADIVGVSAAIKPGAHVISNEGSFDETSFSGKAPWAIARRATQAGATASIFAAIVDPDAKQKAESLGVNICEFGTGLSLEERRHRAAELLEHAVATHLGSGGAFG